MTLWGIEILMHKKDRSPCELSSMLYDAGEYDVHLQGCLCMYMNMYGCTCLYAYVCIYLYIPY
jgi:hypothetical protein